METSENYGRQLTLDELIYSQEGSPANPTHSQESERERRTNATCGQRCLELFESVHRVGSWERTFAGLLIGTEGWYSRRCALTWKLVGTPYNRFYFQLAASALPTEEIASGLLPTPTASDRNGGRAGNKPRKDHNPLTNSLKDGIGYRMQTTSTTWLNPLFVEEMMGFPAYWTASPFQSGDEKV